MGDTRYLKKFFLAENLGAADKKCNSSEQWGAVCTNHELAFLGMDATWSLSNAVALLPRDLREVPLAAFKAVNAKYSELLTFHRSLVLPVPPRSAR